jgi:hypothetical protein
MGQGFHGLIILTTKNAPDKAFGAGEAHEGDF